MKNRKHSVNTMHKLAKRKGIKLISSEYLGITKPHVWECAKGHRWNAQPNNINYIPFGKCPKCSGKAKITIEEIAEMVKLKGGQLKSTSINSLKSNIEIECGNKHVWTTKASNIRDGKWCHQCAGNFPLTIKDLQKKAEDRRGKCLSKIYTNANAWYKWQCSEGHVWKAKYGNIYSGNWCKNCGDSVGERICRQFFEQLFSAKFPACYPKWLVNNNGNKLELDGFSEKLGIAFEHQGNHHYKKNPLFMKSDTAFKQRLKFDEIKRKLCDKNGIKLIEIPEINKKIKPNKLKDYIKNECEKKKIKLPKNYEQIIVDYNIVYITPIWKEKLAQQREIAKKKGGDCLSELYISSQDKLKYQCKNNHVWEATPAKISFGRWCPVCAIVTRANTRRAKKNPPYPKIKFQSVLKPNHARKRK